LALHIPGRYNGLRKQKHSATSSRIFNEEAPVSIVEHIRTITLEASLDEGYPELCGGYYNDVLSLFQHMIKYPRALSPVRLRIYDERWTRTESPPDDWWNPPWKDEPEVSKNFSVEHGHYLENFLGAIGYNWKGRTWEIFPGTPQKKLEFLEYVDKGLADKWYSKGL
jgi:hypothetical protein